MNACKVKSVYARRKLTGLGNRRGHGSQPLARGSRASVSYNFVLQLLDAESWRGLSRRPRVATVPQPLTGASVRPATARTRRFSGVLRRKVGVLRTMCCT